MATNCWYRPFSDKPIWLYVTTCQNPGILLFTLNQLVNGCSMMFIPCKYWCVWKRCIPKKKHYIQWNDHAAADDDDDNDDDNDDDDAGDGCDAGGDDDDKLVVIFMGCPSDGGTPSGTLSIPISPMSPLSVKSLVPDGTRTVPCWFLWGDFPARHGGTSNGWWKIPFFHKSCGASPYDLGNLPIPRHPPALCMAISAVSSNSAHFEVAAAVVRRTYLAPKR